MIFVAVDDLMFSSRISTAAKSVGATIKFTRSPEAVLAAGREATPSLVILDLNSARVKPLEILAALKGDHALAVIPTVGFVSHAARQAGVDRVLARSAFVEQLPNLLTASGNPRNS